MLNKRRVEWTKISDNFEKILTLGVSVEGMLTLISTNVTETPQMQLFCGIEDNDFLLVKDVVENKKIEINANYRRNNEDKEYNVVSPLCWALVYNRIKIAEYLIQRGADPNKAMNRFETALHHLIGTLKTSLSEDPKVIEGIKFLLKHGGSANLAFSGLLPLSLAAHIYPKIIPELIDSGAKVIIPKKDRSLINIPNSPLIDEIVKNNINSIMAMVEHEMVNSKILKKVQVEAENLKLSNELREYLNQALINKLFVEEKSRELNNAIISNDFEKAKKMVEEGAILNGNSIPGNEYPPLYCALKQNHFNIFDYLVSKGADINAFATFRTLFGTQKKIKSNNSVLNWALLEGGNVQYLIDKGADVNKPFIKDNINPQVKIKYYFPLEAAVKKIEVYPENFSILMKNGVFIDLVNIVNKYQGSPLANILKNAAVCNENLKIMLNHGEISSNMLLNVLREVYYYEADSQKKNIVKEAWGSKKRAEIIFEETYNQNQLLSRSKSIFPSIELTKFFDNILIKYRKEEENAMTTEAFKNRFFTLFEEYIPRLNFNKEGLEHILFKIESIANSNKLLEKDFAQEILKTLVPKKWFEEKAKKAFDNNADPFSSDILSVIAKFSSDIEVCKLYLLKQALYFQLRKIVLRENILEKAQEKIEKVVDESENIILLVGENLETQNSNIELYQE